MPGPAFLRGDEVALHTVEEEDLDFLQQHCNDPAIRFGLTLAHPQNRHQAEQAFERHSESDDGVGLLICPRDGDGSGDADHADEADAARGAEATDDAERSAAGSAPQPVGQVVLFDIDEAHGTAEMSCWVAPGAQSSGYATAGTRLLLDYAFAERRLHKVAARALVTNEGSRAVLERLGLDTEGVQRDEKYVDGEHVDVVRYAVLRREWGGA